MGVAQLHDLDAVQRGVRLCHMCACMGDPSTAGWMWSWSFAQSVSVSQAHRAFRSFRTLAEFNLKNIEPHYVGKWHMFLPSEALLVPYFVCFLGCEYDVAQVCKHVRI